MHDKLPLPYNNYNNKTFVKRLLQKASKRIRKENNKINNERKIQDTNQKITKKKQL